MVWPVDLMAFVEVSCSSDQSGDLMQMDPKIPNSAWFIIIPGSEQHSSTTRQDRPVSGPRSHPPRGASGGLRRRASDTSGIEAHPENNEIRTVTIMICLIRLKFM